MWILLGYPSNILGYPCKYCNYTSKKKLGQFPHSSWPPIDNFLIFISQKIVLNIKDVEFDFRMGCILVLFPFLCKCAIYTFWNFEFLIFKISHISLFWSRKKNPLNFSKTTFTYQTMDEITLTHSGWAWEVQKLIFCHFWHLKNLLHTHSNTCHRLNFHCK